MSLLTLLSPLALRLLHLPWGLVGLAVLAVALLLVSWAAVRLQHEILEAQTPSVRFVGVQVGALVRIDSRLDLHVKDTREYRRSVRVAGDDEDPYLPLRARYANRPPLGLPVARADGVWAELTFTDSSGNAEEHIEVGRWASEPQTGIDSPLEGPLQLSGRSRAGSIDFPPNAPPEDLDVVTVRLRTREVWAWDAQQRPHPLSRREYLIKIILHGSPMQDLETNLKLVVPDEGDPILREETRIRAET